MLTLAIGMRDPTTGIATLVGPNGASGTAALPIQHSGNTAADWTANDVAVPPFGNALYLAGAPPNGARNCISVMNQSAFEVYVVRDMPIDPAMTVGGVSGATGITATQTTIVLPPVNEGATGQASPSWVSPFFKGRIRVFGASGATAANVAVFED